MKRSYTIVIKLGTSSIVDEATHQPLLSILSSIVETVLNLKNDGHRVVLVSSGAIGVGLKRMDMMGKPKTLAGHQALAAIGQGRLIALWDDLFGHLGQPIAQVLITRGDISERSRYLNAVNTLTELLNMGVIPIVNENDTVAVREIKFGDNDTLSAITSSMLHADYLFLLTDVEALYTANPRKDPFAKAIDVVSSISAIRAEVNTTSLGSKLGTGGMETKLIAAEIATGAGTATVITSSKNPKNILSIIEYNRSIQAASPSEPVSTDNSHSCTPTTRPPHTLFTPSPTPLPDLKSWTSHTLTPSGSVIIDTGAHHVLSRRDSGGRLLPAGVVDVRGGFASGQAVRIAVRRRKKGPDDRDSAPSRILDPYMTYLDGSPITQPSTPTLLPAVSLSSSIASLEPLSRSGSMNDTTLTPSSSSSTVTETLADGGIRTPNETEEEEEGWDVVEVGRGLANYNWAEINRVKGLKSAYITQLLGYADSEYVVENITIRLPP
ncbi:glutamate 5-kinase [Gautieria morchelliformis]|nr:glutamate 5-kinase [Gautieria morchelliformis]